MPTAESHDFSRLEDVKSRWIYRASPSALSTADPIVGLDDAVDGAAIRSTLERCPSLLGCIWK